MTTPELPPLHWVGAMQIDNASFQSLATEASVEARERILLARIAELVEALEASTEIMARMYGPQAESLPPVVRNRKAIDAARKA